MKAQLVVGGAPGQDQDDRRGSGHPGGKPAAL